MATTTSYFKLYFNAKIDLVFIEGESVEIKQESRIFLVMTLLQTTLEITATFSVRRLILFLHLDHERRVVRLGRFAQRHLLLVKAGAFW